MKNQLFYKVCSAILIVMLAFAAVPVKPASAADTGLNSPTSCTSGGGEWTNPGNATASDNQYTQANANNEDIICTFNLSAIPAGNTIVGIEVVIEGSSSGSREAAVDLSWTGGIDPPGPSSGYTTGDPSTTFGSTETTFTLGGASNNWGRTWSNTEFTAANFRVRLTANNGSGTISLDHIQVRVTYFPPLTITASAGAGGTITPSGAVAVDNGEDQNFDIEPSTGFIVADVLVDGGSVGRLNYYDFNNVTTDHTISATFDGGWSQPSDDTETGWDNTDEAYVSDNDYADATGAGDVVSFEDFNFSIPTSATINGIEVAIEGNAETTAEVSVDLSWNGGGSHTGSDPSTNFVNGGEDATIVLGGAANTWGRTWSATEFSNANFRVRLTTTGADDIFIDQIQVKIHFTAPSHTITASAGAGGTITPSGAIVVYQGFDQDFDITPSSTFIVSDVLIDGGSAGRINYHEFTNVITSHTIAASFDGGWSQPSADVDTGWSNEDEVYASDNDYALANADTDVAHFFNFGLSIPGGATITGIEVAIEGNATTTRELVVDLSWNSGSNFTPTTFTTNFVNGGSDATLVLGGTAETWGRTWSPAEFANFRIRLDATGGTGDVNVDQVQVKVHYTVITPTTLTVNSATGTYGGTTSLTATISPAVSGKTINFTLNGNPAGSAVTDGSGIANIPAASLVGINAGTYPGGVGSGVGASFAGDSTHGASTASPNTLTVNPANATIVVNPYNVTYDGSPHTSTGTATGVLGEDLSASLNLSATTHTNAGTYNGDAWSFNGGTNYNNANGTVDNVISPANATIVVNPYNVTYDGSPHTSTGTATGVLGEDLSAGLNLSGTTHTNAGTYNNDPWTFTDLSGNYVNTNGTVNNAINAASATITLSDLNHTYDGTAKSATVVINPLGLSFSITYDGSPTAPTNADNYAVVATITDPNYSGTANDTLVIAPATVTPSITANNKVYDGNTTASFTCSLTGIIGTDDVTCSGTANFDNKNVGTDKTVTATGITLGGADATNYTLSTNSATDLADITARDLNVTATGINKVYDGNTNATVTLNDDRVGGDDLTLAYTSASFASPNVGNGILVSVSGINISSGADAGNYNLVNNSTTTNADITPAGQTITVTTSAPASAANGSSFDVAATASSGLPVTITTSGSCSGGDTDGDATITMTSGTGTCSVFYNQAGDSNYTAAPQVQEDVNATESPVFTSADNTTFDFGFSDTFLVMTTGNPSSVAITMSGEPAGVTLIDNGNGTATLNYDGTTSPGVYTITFFGANGVLPNGTQTFTLTIRNGPAVSTVNSLPDTGNGSVSENENISTTLGITQIMVEFDRDVYDAGASDPDSVTNPANYLLVRSATGTFSTASCSGGLVAPDVQISMDSVTYDNGSGSGPFVATLNVNSGLPLNVAGFYRLFVCGTTSIVDAGNPLLALAGNGVTPGTDFTRNFRIAAPVTGGGGGGGGSSSTTTTTALTGLLIPVTGFAPSQMTELPAQPIEKEYSKSELTLKIPSLGVNLPIVGVKLDENGWDVTWLGNNAGYLEGSAYPTWNGNSILTSHVTDPNGKPGPFAYVNELRDGDKVYIHNDGFIYVYEVRESSLISPRSIKTLFKSEEDAWLTLVTCENFNEKTNTFTHRRVIRAVLISVIPEK